MRRTIVSAALFVCGCASATGPSTETRPCNPLAGWADVAQASVGKYLIFGETHGTREGPLAVQEFVCQVATRPVLLAVEIDSSRNDELQSAWQANDETSVGLPEALRDMLVNRSDGVGSQAMVDMIVKLQALKSSGADIDIVAFNGARDNEQAKRFEYLPGQEPHEAAQAENIRLAAAKRQYRHVVVLAGSVHGQKSPVKVGDVTFEPMAMKLGLASDVVSMRMETAGGAAWNCRMKPGGPPLDRPIVHSDLDCSAHPLTGTARSEPVMTLAETESRTFDGYYFVGPVSASPPAAP